MKLSFYTVPIPIERPINTILGSWANNHARCWMVMRVFGPIGAENGRRGASRRPGVTRTNKDSAILLELDPVVSFDEFPSLANLDPLTQFVLR